MSGRNLIIYRSLSDSWVLCWTTNTVCVQCNDGECVSVKQEQGNLDGKYPISQYPVTEQEEPRPKFSLASWIVRTLEFGNKFILSNHSVYCVWQRKKN